MQDSRKSSYYPALMVLLIALLAQFQIVSAYAVDGSFGPVEGFDGIAEGFQIGYILCLQMFGEFLI